MRKRGRMVGTPNADTAMTFEAISAALGVSQRTVYSAYQGGMRKLRNDLPNALAWMQVLAADLQAERAARLDY